MARTVDILDGSTFVVSNDCGDIDGSPAEPHGLFRDDTRYLSRWVLTLDDQRLASLSVDTTRYYAAQFFLAPGVASAYINAKVAVIRRRRVADGFHEMIAVTNHDSVATTMQMALLTDADFADLFEVKDAITKKAGDVYRRVDEDRLVLGYQRGSYRRETWIRATGARYADAGLYFDITLEPQQSWTTDVAVFAVEHLDEVTDFPAGVADLDAGAPTGLRLESDSPPVLACDWAPLERIYSQSIRDLTALRFDLKARPGHYLPAAGLPWFMAAFGRDSLITSFQALPFMPELARSALLTLGALQAQRPDDFRDAEPGKILHELRFGELTAFEERPHSPYYGAADSTPLWLVLLDEYERWTGRADLVHRLEPEARAALRWIDEFGDRDGDGYIEYERRNTETGLENQCWKDSWDSIQWADGTLASFPRATCELQGYAYDAKLRCARLAREVWDDRELADRLEAQAAELKERFNRDFWVDDGASGGYYAVALDGEKRRVDTLTSNIGHLLWSGIVPDDRAPLVAAHLMGERLYTGWGIRTLATGQTGYNPIGYHLGTVWPHDTAIAVLGLLRYGFRDEAGTIAMSLLQAADMLGNRLPEAFAGFSREEAAYPAEYPTACSPQAWASGAPLMLVRALLGLTPDGAILRSSPRLPPELRMLHLFRVPGRWGATDVGVDMSDEVVRAGVPDDEVAELISTISRRIDPMVSVGRRLSIGFDLGAEAGYRLLLEDGRATLDAHAAAADCVIRTDRATLLEVLRLERSYSTAMMSDRLQVHGDRLIALAFFVSAAGTAPAGG
ncbi:MAG TPA: glycogen debranching N-terminal domain-containing protein, partial [Jatrophihabitans sp.]|nr:glycogen debranching N-terminal domain-containing protein [Jatrophihabitans sp.]